MSRLFFICGKTSDDCSSRMTNRDAFNTQQEAKNTKLFSAAYLLCFFWGLASICVQEAVLAISYSLHSYIPNGFHEIGICVCSGVFVLLAGCFGYVTSLERTKLRWMKMTLIMATLSIGLSIVAAILSGMAASSGVLPGCYDSKHGEQCEPWICLQWCLMAISVLAAINSIVLAILASDGFCCSNYSNIPVRNQQAVNTGTGNNQQPNQVKQQPMQLNAQQLSTFQLPYVPQLIQSRYTPQPVSATAPSALAQVQQH